MSRLAMLAGLEWGVLGSWSWRAKAALLAASLAAVTGLGYGVQVRDGLLDLERSMGREAALRGEIAEKSVQAALSEGYHQQIDALQHRLESARQRLQQGDAARLLEDVARLGDGLWVEQFKLLDEVPHAYFVEQPLELNAIGAYPQLTALLAGLAGLSRIVTLTSLQLAPAEAKAPGQLQLRLLASTYRAGDQSKALEHALLPVIVDASAPLPHDPFAAVEPLESRTLLERLALEQFEMVGSLRGRQGRVALLRGAGSIHRIQLEDRLGPDHGRVVAISEHQVELVEQVFIEGRGWLERPRTLVLKQADRGDGR